MDKKTLEKLKKIELEILIVLDKYCKEHNIKYSICAGTALGAVRHGGFIPWDDDIDITMTRSEYEKFRKSWKQNPIKGYYFENYIDNPNCDISHGKIRKDGTVLISEGCYSENKHNGIWVDIFPMDRINSLNEKKVKKIGRSIILLTRANVIFDADSKKNRLIKKLIRLIPKSIRANKLKKDYYRLLENDKNVQNDYRLISMSTINSLKFEYPQTLLSNFITINFENTQVMITSEYDKLLKIFYGDYMKIPPIEERVCTHNPIKVEFGE